MIFRIVYVSRATQEFTEDELLNMLRNARPRNEEHGITGMLLYGSSNFMQVLEGEQDALDQLFNNITKDERHKDCNVIDYSEIKNRAFPNWSMGFKLIDQDTKLDGYSEFMQCQMTPKELSQNPTSVLGLLYSFKSETVDH